MALALDELKDSDYSTKENNLTFLIDKDLSKKVGKVKVDFIEQGYKQGFSVSSENPVSSGPSSCGGSCSC